MPRFQQLRVSNNNPAPAFYLEIPLYELEIIRKLGNGKFGQACGKAGGKREGGAGGGGGEEK